MSELLDQHLRRIKAASTERLQMRDLATWVERNTFINGRPFSFKGHEYQRHILSDDSREICIRKCSQVGISEMSIRMALGLTALMPSYSVIYSFPTANFSRQYVKSRVDPVIEGSPYLRAAVSNDVDSSEVKRVGAHNFLYFKGAAVGNAAISVAADHLVHDELDFSSPEIISTYTSRLTHSPFKRKTKLSTPTLPGGPIDLAFQQSRRHFMLCKCDKCSHTFLPSYYEHIKIPGWNDDLRKITADNLHTTRYKEAQLLCPRCGRAPSLMPEYREYVLENPDQAYSAVGYQVSPLDAPALIALPDLITTSTQYERLSDFHNFSLGQPSEDAENGLTQEDIEKVGINLDTSPSTTHCIGIDLGLLCRVMVGCMTADGQVMVVHSEEIPVGEFRRRYAELCKEYRITSKVSDAQPYVETILALQESDGGLFGAFFVETDRLELFRTTTREENIRDGKTPMRQVQINRNKALDLLMLEIRGDAEAGVPPSILINRQDEETWKKIKEQLTDMRRTREVTSAGEFTQVWRKSSKRSDHYHHSLLYLWIAIKLRGVPHAHTAMTALPMPRKFKLRDPFAPKPGR